MHRLLEMHSATLAARRFENNEIGKNEPGAYCSEGRHSGDGVGMVLNCQS